MESRKKLQGSHRKGSLPLALSSGFPSNKSEIAIDSMKKYKKARII